MKKSVSVSEVFARYFNENEIQVIKDAILHGSWGDAEVCFGDESEDAFGFGYCTNDAKMGGHFVGRQISGLFSSISKKIKEFGIRWMVHFPNWWGDGTGDMLFIRCRQINDKDHSGPSLYDIIEDWAHDGNPDFPEGFGEEVSEEVSVKASEKSSLPEIKERWINDPHYAEKYVKKGDIAHECNTLHEWLSKNGGSISNPTPGINEPKAAWLRFYKFLSQAVSLAEVVTDVNEKIGEESNKPEIKTSEPANAPIVNRGTAQERLDRYTAELEARMAGTLTDLEGRALNKRIASLKRKISRANKALGLPESK